MHPHKTREKLKNQFDKGFKEQFAKKEEQLEKNNEILANQERELQKQLQITKKQQEKMKNYWQEKQNEMEQQETQAKAYALDEKYRVRLARRTNCTSRAW